MMAKCKHGFGIAHVGRTTSEHCHTCQIDKLQAENEKLKACLAEQLAYLKACEEEDLLVDVLGMAAEFQEALEAADQL